MELNCINCGKEIHINDYDLWDLYGNVVKCPKCGFDNILDYTDGWNGEEEFPMWYLTRGD